jgi:hypothetical protein
MRISDFSLFLVSYWLNVLLFPVSNGGKESSRKTAGVTLSALPRLEEKSMSVGMMK